VIFSMPVSTAISVPPTSDALRPSEPMIPHDPGPRSSGEPATEPGRAADTARRDEFHIKPLGAYPGFALQHAAGRTRRQALEKSTDDQQLVVPPEQNAFHRPTVVLPTRPPPHRQPPVVTNPETVALKPWSPVVALVAAIVMAQTPPAYEARELRRSAD
jgi:hypothetical protein